MHNDTIMQCTTGIEGIPIIGSLYANDLFVCILLACFFLIAAVLASNENVLSNILENFFKPREHTGTKTTSALYLRLSMYGVCFISTALFLTVYLVHQGSLDTTQGNRILPLLLAGIIIAYLLKLALFKAVNWVFFDKAHTLSWEQSYADWTLISGIIMYVIALIAVLLDFSAHTLSIWAIAYLVLIEICLFFKSFHIFCIKRYGSLQLIVYLCTLELIPLLLAGKVLVLYA